MFIKGQEIIVAATDHTFFVFCGIITACYLSPGDYVIVGHLRRKQMQ